MVILKAAVEPDGMSNLQLQLSAADVAYLPGREPLDYPSYNAWVAMICFPQFLTVLKSMCMCVPAC